METIETPGCPGGLGRRSNSIWGADVTPFEGVAISRIVSQ